MRVLPRLLAPLALLFGALVVSAAPSPADSDPEPGAGPLPALDRFLPDDAHFVLSIDVKGILASPLFTKQLDKDAKTLLAIPAVDKVLKSAGLNPLKDIDRIVV